MIFYNNRIFSRTIYSKTVSEEKNKFKENWRPEHICKNIETDFKRNFKILAKQKFSKG